MHLSSSHRLNTKLISRPSHETVFEPMCYTKRVHDVIDVIINKYYSVIFRDSPLKVAQVTCSSCLAQIENNNSVTKTRNVSGEMD